jgi:hypothetical protein
MKHWSQELQQESFLFFGDKFGIFFDKGGII